MTCSRCCFPPSPQQIKDGWIKQKKQLLEDVRASGAAAFWQAAVSHLASITIVEGELEKAESLLKELPQHSTDSTSIWAMLYLKKGEAPQALEVIQKRLYVLTRQVQSFLTQMMNPEMTPDTARTLELCVIYRQLEELLGVGNGMSPGFFAQAYQRAGQDQQALDSMIQFVDAITGTVQKPNPILFSPAVKIDGEHPAATKEMRELLLKSLLDDGYYKQFHDNKRFMDAVDKLRGSIHIIVQSTNNACVSLRWFRDTFGREAARQAQAAGCGIYPYLDRLADTAPAGAGGLIWLPYLAGEQSPVWDTRARGVFYG